jgi:hypothetical protein
MTTRQYTILRKMREEGEELVYERGQGYVGLTKVSSQFVFRLLRLCAIRLDQSSSVGKFERYTISETGLELLKKAERG